MSIPRITGRQARNLLDGTTPGPWVWDQQLECVVDPPYSLADLHVNAEGNGELIAAAPDLAETVAWLYGRPSDETVPGDEHWDTEGFLVEVRDGRVAMFDDEATTTYLSVDQAVDLARALLAAAEEARP